jgi:chorismate dehydratase
MTIARLGAVDYLNARPLVYGLELRNDLFTVRFDVPSKCAALLHEGSIDVGMIPSIEYLRGHDYRIAPGIGIISDGPVASVALFTTVPRGSIRSIAADTSSRTSIALLRILCAERFGVDAEFHPTPPEPELMLARHDAALLIGDPALFLEHERLGAEKIDLGQEWTSMTGLPFVWAFWAGRRGALSRDHVSALVDARDAGVAESDSVAEAYCGPERAARGKAYLRENVYYVLGDREEEGLRAYYDFAERCGVVDRVKPPEFFGSAGL